MKRKVLAGILAAAMMASLLTGCGNKQASDGGGQSGAETESAAKTESAEGTEPAAGEDSGKPSAAEDPKLTKNMKILSIWAEDNDNGVLIKALCEKYQKEVNPNFTWDYEVVSSDNLRQKVATLVASNDLPDMFVYESGKPIVDLIEAGKLVNVSKVLKDFNCEDALNPSAVSLLKSLSGTDDIYDLPLGMNVEGFWYNKALFEQAGCQVPKTWDEFESVLAKLKGAGIQPIACGAADKWGATRILNSYLVRIAGPDAMSKADEGISKYTDEDYVKAAQKMQDWANAGYFGEGVNTVDMNTAGSMLMTGQAAVFYNGSWFTSNLNDASQNLAGEDGIGFFNVPVVDPYVSDESSYSMNCGNILSFSQKNYDEATGWFIKYFAENMGDLAMELQGSVKGYNYTVSAEGASGYTQMVLDTINNAESAFTWFEATMGNEVQNVAKDGIQTLLTGELSAEDYMKSIQEAWDMSQ